MGNMGYVRFHNTYGDLQECLEHMEDDLSESEQEARRDLIQLCMEIVESYGELA